MNSHDKVVQYLDEARATEAGLVRELQAQIAMTPRGSYRSLLEKHLRETRSQAERLRRRLDELDHGQNPLELVGGVAQMVVGQALSLSRAPLAIVRGTGGEEKVLKNAKDACAAEALEIATYIALERVARAVDDERTAELAASIRAEEERMLERLHAELPKLAQRVVRAEIPGDPTYALGKIGAFVAILEVTVLLKSSAKDVGDCAKKAARQARK